MRAFPVVVISPASPLHLPCISPASRRISPHLQVRALPVLVGAAELSPAHCARSACSNPHLTPNPTPAPNSYPYPYPYPYSYPYSYPYPYPCPGTISGSALHSCKGDGFSSNEREALLVCRDEHGNRILEGGNGLKVSSPAEPGGEP